MLEVATLQHRQGITIVCELRDIAVRARVGLKTEPRAAGPRGPLERGLLVVRGPHPVLLMVVALQAPDHRQTHVRPVRLEAIAGRRGRFGRHERRCRPLLHTFVLSCLLGARPADARAQKTKRRSTRPAVGVEGASSRPIYIGIYIKVYVLTISRSSENMDDGEGIDDERREVSCDPVEDDSGVMS